MSRGHPPYPRVEPGFLHNLKLLASPNIGWGLTLMSKIRATFSWVLFGALIIGFVAGYFFAAPLRGGLIVALQQILTTPAAAAALIAAGVTFIVGLVSPLLTFLIGSKQATNARISADAAMMTAKYTGTRALAHLRIDWLNSVRDTLSQYHSILMTPKQEDPSEDGEAIAKAKEKAAADRRQLSFLGTKLDLLLNQEKKFQQALWRVTDEILKTTDVRPLSDEELDAADKHLVVAARKVLDFHWQKIKNEILAKPELIEPLYEPPKQHTDG